MSETKNNKVSNSRDHGSVETLNDSSRRGFFRKSAIAGAAITTPYIWTSSSAAEEEKKEKPTVACIGVGGSRGRYNRGREIARHAAKLGRTIAVCDCDQLHNEEYNAEFDGKLNEYTDYRELFEKEKPDIVTIGTPDHWHVPIALHALDAGCHVYCEKPLTLTIGEGKVIRDAVKKSGKVFQVGTQQRTEMGQLFMYATAIVRSGRLGENVNAHVAINAAPEGGPFETTEVPEGLDWDIWLGPTNKTGYSDKRRKEFRWFLEYSGGKMTDWGAHHIDIAQWALGLDHTGPNKVSGVGKLTPIVPDNFNWAQFFDGELTLPNGFNAATEFHINLDFAEGNRIDVNHEYEKGTTSFGNGILFEGDKGRMFVNRGKLQGSIVKDIFGMDLKSGKKDGKRFNNYKEAKANVDQTTQDEFRTAFEELHKGKVSKSHMENFFACVADGGEPISDVDSHVNTMNSCHLCNVNLMLGRDLAWDSEAENFGSDEQANALLTRKSREGYQVNG
ncbi:Gfo/Idh/MocA family oxidoreductase [Mariniblastus sp.]|nr:Gfo/Idh/MocA family oxidoreductase [Mariniblastus sp.]